MAKTGKNIFIFAVFGSALIVSFFFFTKKDARHYDASLPKTVTVTIDGFSTPFCDSTAKTVGELLDRSGLDVSPDDEIFPERAVPLSSGMNVAVSRMKAVLITVDGGTRTIRTTARTVEGAFDDAEIILKDDDLVAPDLPTLLLRSMKVTVIRVEVREESVDKPIAFSTTTTEDDTLSWRKKITKQKGISGVRTSRYRVSYHDGKEVARKLLGSEVTKDPVPEVVVQGTYVKTGKAVSGMGTWYSYTGKLAAASLSLPLGSYARVTNPENGKAVIVVINDRGPYGKGRIIDLDKVAFEQIAPLGAGVITVKVEPVLN
ncbi:MAG: G5 domain-containing protein [Candidatus Moraniibacteriota bacterium]